MDEGRAMLLALSGMGVVGFSCAALLFVGTPGWPIAVWFVIVAAMFGWLGSRIVRDA